MRPPLVARGVRLVTTGDLGDPYFGRLSREIARFSNHAQRWVRASQKYRAVLESASEWSGGTAPLDETPEDPRVAMRAIDQYARIHREPRATLFGAYFAHHHLMIQARLARELLRQSMHPDPQHRVRTCHRIYTHADDVRREWVSTLLELSIASAVPELGPKDYAAFNVGALTDHEDVDLAIVVRTPEAKEALSRGFAPVAKTFLRFASKIQLFLTEGLDQPGAGATITEFSILLQHPNRRVVSVMQLLGAQYLCGDRGLERGLHERVIRQYYAGHGDPLVHEGFLRAIRNELRVFLRSRPVPSIVAPKREVYYPAKMATAAVRVIHNVTTPRPPDALQAIAERDPNHMATYRTLADAFVQLEVLRSLVFLFVYQGDELDLSDPSELLAVRRVAVLFGLAESARRRPEERLIGTYMDLRGRALQSIWTIANEIDRHLERIGTFRHVVDRGVQTPVEEDNLVERILEALENHRGSVFWDEVVALVTSSERGRRFIDDFVRLPEREHFTFARRYVAMMVEDASALVEFLVFLASRAPEENPVATIFWDALITHLASHTDALIPFVERLDAETKTEALFRLAVAFSPIQLATLADLLERRDPTMRSARVVRSLRSVIFLVHHRSNAIGRVANRVLARTPEFLRRLGDMRRLRELTQKILDAAAREPDPETQIELLGDSFDVATLRASLIAMLEGAPADRDSELTAAVDRYVRELFKACFREVRQRSPMFQLYRPGSGIAVFATGGYGRGEAFGGDFDYIAVARGGDPGLKKFFGKVLQRVSNAMSRRGLHPHNRFTGQFNAWVVRLPELIDYLSERREETFIDEAEMLEARFLLGDPALARAFNEQVVGMVLNESRELFIRDILGELDGRRDRLPNHLNLKEGRGGLREIHLIMLALRCHAGLKGPMGASSLELVAKDLPGTEPVLRALWETHRELRRARELYRLTVAFDDNIEPEQLEEVAYDLLPLREAGVRTPYRPYLEQLMSRTADVIDRLREELSARV